jgi:hypothetical protein
MKRKHFQDLRTPIQLKYCTNVSNGLEARSTKSEFSCGVGVPPARKKLIDIGARSEIKETGFLENLSVTMRPIVKTRFLD